MKMQQTSKGIKKLKTLVANPDCDVNNFRLTLENTFTSPFLPNGIQISKKTIKDVPCDVLLPEVCSLTQTILYVHGGSFIGGSTESWRNFCASIAHVTCTKVIVPSYRLAPQNPYPSAIEDIKAVIKKMYASSKDIIFMADSAGASILFGVLFKIKGEFRKRIKNVILFSPWLDLTKETQKKQKSKDKIVTREAMKWSAELYTYSENIKAPHISPVLASDEDFALFPPVYIQLAEGELIEEDCLEFQQRLKKLGLTCEIDSWKNMVHMFQRADEFFTESHLAIEKIGKYVIEKEVE